MLNRQIIITLGLLASILICPAFADELEDNFNNYLHYAKIGRLDLAKSYAQAVIQSEPDSKVMLELVEENPRALYLIRRAWT